MWECSPRPGDSPPTRLFLVAGEPSGDLHAANLIEAIKQQRPEIEFVGLGGPRMQRAGCHLLRNMMEMSWMWFGQVLTGLRKVLRLERETHRYLEENPPEAAVLVDFPGFNLRLAGFLRKRNIPVIYYISPQVWAWAPWRIKKIRKRVSKMLVILPFEEQLYRDAGVDVEYVGHPLFEHLREEQLDPTFPAMIHRAEHPTVVGLLPGSRAGVVAKSVPVMLAAARRIHGTMPDTHFVISCQQEAFRELIEPAVKRASFPIQVVDRHTLELMDHADLCLVSSGTATLELAHFATPMVVVYRVSLPEVGTAKVLMRTKFFSLVNVLAGRRVVPEYLLWRDNDPRPAQAVIDLLGDDAARARMREELARVMQSIDHPGGSTHAARAVMRFLDAARQPSRRSADTRSNTEQ